MISRLLHRLGWYLPLALVLLIIAIIFLAPPEKTLGETIRLVYAHVAFTRGGMYGFYAAGILGLVVAVTNRSALQAWAQTIGWVSLALFAVGGIFSIFAQRASWGGMLLAEPRNRTSMSVLAVAVIILLVNEWIPWIRVRGLLYAALAAYVLWIIPRTPLILHPSNAGGSSPSAAIRLTFPALTFLVMLLGAWVVWYFRRPEA